MILSRALLNPLEFVWFGIEITISVSMLRKLYDMGGLFVDFSFILLGGSVDYREMPLLSMCCTFFQVNRCEEDFIMVDRRLQGEARRG
jgi:hypothetical protein